MPKIEMYRSALDAYIGERYEREELEEKLVTAKAEVDEWEDEEGILKIELNDTNRPDLWSAAGLGRQLRVRRTGERPSYNFFSAPGKLADAGERRIVVDESVREIRPYVVGFAVSGKAIDEATLKDVIQSQEKLCWNYGQKREAVAMGIYRSELMRYPVRYRGADPDEASFVPLQMEEELSLRRILSEHPKGLEFGHIVADKPRMPLLTDDRGDVLSFPPIINSARIGAVEVGDSELFVEMTGGNLEILLLACSVVACDMADSGFTVHPVSVEYPFDTPYGRTVVTPFYFQEPIRVSPEGAGKLLGVEMEPDEVVRRIEQVGSYARMDGDEIEVQPAEYRNDFLHPVDVYEDVMIGRGMDSFEPAVPHDFTVGRLTAEEELARRVKLIMVGLGYQEMVFSYLGSRRDYIGRMRPEPVDRQEPIDPPSRGIVQIANPMSENYELVRNSILPHLLGAETVSANAAYPHRMFEVGKTACVDRSLNYGTRTDDTLGFLVADAEASFNTLRDHIAVLLYYLNLDHTLAANDDERFIRGRRADVLVGDRTVGLLGEVHPQVLVNWGIEVPCVAAELRLTALPV